MMSMNWRVFNNIALLGFLGLMLIVVTALTVWHFTDRGPRPQYRVILMDVGYPARAIISWTAPELPTIEGPGMVSWRDSVGRYRLVSGNVIIEQLLEQPGAPAPQPASDQELEPQPAPAE